ncbi:MULTISPECIES: laminin/fibronectin-binding adhesin Lsa30 [Leptospira]|uniref:Lipoprotein n=7 Tax=Leptospira borgpetersenii TaxID=174 RepID=M3HUR9_LEPBO|nr:MULTISPECIES: hypothetical protein [Leptospira]EMG01330.1 hypothetical protein LEP1GSC123_3876 [Leptospira borgpetersenii str. 200701203]EMO09367.1 hypothetical protein LEP1GSC137_2076 [Leptospira borgpetersenii str. Noumea 25]ABJ76574.1 Hypothetical lipoprotein [Leptospira borgpetersenii serovar Hardjo-bovis str. JB197]ABJ78511.1 Hypothetical lipoprotein [Leptospira borgpetersenii serovar Hardjo-bovis str. L550]ALO24932.1 lipoprotein [Leptospira borgpetersenii serovar Ballum]
MTRNTATLFKLLFFCIFLGNCTFGSVGDSRKEDAKTLQRLLILFNERPASFGTRLYYTDDQQDSNIGNFDVVSAATVYNLQLQPGSKILWDGVSIRVNPNPIPTVPGQTRTFDAGDHSAKSHTPYTIPLDLPVTSPYGQEYGTPSFNDSNLETTTETILTGDVHTSSVPLISGIPSGYLASVKYKINSIDLTFQIVAPAAKTVRLQIPSFTLELFPRCRFDITPEKQGNFPVIWRSNGILQDQGSVSILNSISALPNPVDINPYQNVNLYDLISANFRQQDRVIYQIGCNLF